ncbi:ABC transporter permease [Pseudobutyrivibrio sp.]|uniref:ABC transporter permease n=1 Tax=Pseudobutyrivibrio sp. TaxID=2014367 RepID=UPI0025EA7182|nr:ABC transporter permease [Pseudobutyrivibrio sp.]
MFIRMFFYKIKEISRNRTLLGWNLVFPLVLSTAFFLGFGNMIKDDPDTFKTIDVGYVNTDEENSPFSQVLTSLSKKNDGTQVLEVHKFSDVEDAKTALDGDEVEGIYIEESGEVKTIVPANGLVSTTLNQIVREYENGKVVIENIAKDHPENMMKAISMLEINKSVLKEYDFGTNTSPYLQYYFALIAMSSLFSSWISTRMLEGMCANLSENGKRFECAPVYKLPSIVAGILAGVVLQAISNAIVVFYVEGVLGIEFGIPLLNILAITTLGSAVGISFGVLIGSLCKHPNLLVAIPLCFSMTCSFLSGLMWHQIRQFIEYHCPIINRINPAALLTDCLYVRATYGKTEVYYRDIFTMLIIIAACLIISAMFLRRRKYVSL